MSKIFFAPAPMFRTIFGKLSVITLTTSTNTPASQSNAFEIASMIGLKVAIAFDHLLLVVSLPLIASLTFLIIVIRAPSAIVNAATHGFDINNFVKLLQAVPNFEISGATPPIAPPIELAEPVICVATSAKLSFNDNVAIFAFSVFSDISFVVLVNSNSVELYC